jgi:hypothetical protein
MSQATQSRLTLEELKLCIVTFYGAKAKTADIVGNLKAIGTIVTADRVNKALGRFSKVYSGKVSKLTPHKAALLSAVRETVPMPYADQYLLNLIGQADTLKGAMKRIESRAH